MTKCSSLVSESILHDEWIGNATLHIVQTAQHCPLSFQSESFSGLVVGWAFCGCNLISLLGAWAVLSKIKSTTPRVSGAKPSDSLSCHIHWEGIGQQRERQTMMALALSTRAKKRLSPSFSFFFWSVSTGGTVMLTPPPAHTHTHKHTTSLMYFCFRYCFKRQMAVKTNYF